MTVDIDGSSLFQRSVCFVSLPYFPVLSPFFVLAPELTESLEQDETALLAWIEYDQLILFDNHSFQIVFSVLSLCHFHVWHAVSCSKSFRLYLFICVRSYFRSFAFFFFFQFSIVLFAKLLSAA